MPMYLWKCEVCDCAIEVIRSVSQYENPPEADDGVVKSGEKGPPCTDSAHKWSRRIPSGSGQFHLVGYGWAKDGYR